MNEDFIVIPERCAMLLNATNNEMVVYNSFSASVSLEPYACVWNLFTYYDTSSSIM